ncbi:MAG: DNA-directed RNA polymerase subunit omega [Clostridiales bacterium]|mgnify:CR=1 FL=1|nr:DNA-directed RNA polymerase subunit omega [Clostridiales bacterium]
MIDPPLGEVTKKIDNRYALVVGVSKRARQLVDGMDALVEVDSTNPVTVAIYELLDEKFRAEQI